VDAAAFLCWRLTGLDIGKPIDKDQNIICALLFFHDESMRIPWLPSVYPKTAKCNLGKGD
jgi:hypothetical protein